MESRYSFTMRKSILRKEAVADLPQGIDIPSVATALISSEDPAHPIENAFDSHHGPGSSYWQAQDPGDQNIVLAFDTPQPIQQISLEVEELESPRSQEVQISVSTDQGRTYKTVVTQGFNFSPPGTTFEREIWTVNLDPITHLRLLIKPDTHNQEGYASLTSLILQ